MNQLLLLHVTFVILILTSKNQLDHVSTTCVNELCKKQCSKVNEIAISCPNVGLLNVSDIRFYVTSVTNKLKKLNLVSNKIQEIYEEDFENMPNLEEIYLNNNEIRLLKEKTFANLSQLRILRLDHNRLENIPEDCLQFLSNLEVLNLDGNHVTEFEINSPNLKTLSLSRNRIRELNKSSFKDLKDLVFLNLNSNQITKIGRNSFANLYNLRTLILSENKKLCEFPDLNGTKNLDYLYIDRCQLTSIPENCPIFCPNLRSLDLKSNLLTHVPNLKHCKNLGVLNLAYNQIKSLGHSNFDGLHQLLDLLLNHNDIEYLNNDTFNGLYNLQTLDLGNNRISLIDEGTFSVFKKLKNLNLGNNIFARLPIQGLQHLQHLKAHNNPEFRDFPDPKSFRSIQSLALSYAYHCCAFLNDCKHKDSKLSPLKETIYFHHNLSQLDFEKLWNSSQVLWSTNDNPLNKNVVENQLIGDIWKLYETQIQQNITNTYPNNSSIVTVFDGDNEENDDFRENSKVKCLPLPGPFQPCRDLFDWWALRCGVWIIFLLALLGNGTVVIVIVFARTKLDVPRFLVCNLAVADFFMGVYLGFLAFVDASTLGEFRKFAIPWQVSLGCKTAGFLGVLSTELSVYTLSVITLERNYAITHAMHLNKRLSLKHAGVVMIFGWVFATFMAILPLYGVSDYRKFAICLPFETRDPVSLVYIIILISINGIAFFILIGCYLRMYWEIRESQAWNSNDSRIAKRMSLLVFTDFLCWSPIAFFTLTALAGQPLISLEGAKVLAVFVLPFNSCCNPFLYAIMTKQFKKDCVMICKAIEESRITRGIGRCRHSSNFSNQQTALNADSLLVRSSQENRGCITKRNLMIFSSSDEDKPKGKNSFNLTILFQKKKKVAKSNKMLKHTSDLTYQIAEIQKKQQHYKNNENSQIRTQSHNHQQNQNQNFNVSLNFNETKKRTPPWLNSRKISLDSTFSSSRNDSSSGLGSTNSTNTSNNSRSSITISGVGNNNDAIKIRSKPKLIRQRAVISEDIELDTCIVSSPNKLTVRFLSTIPSTAETSNAQDDDNDDICNV